MEIFSFIFIASVPILYIYGLVNVFRKFGKSNEQKWEERFGDAVSSNRKLQTKVKSLETELAEERKLTSLIKSRADASPEMSLTSLMQELYAPPPPQLTPTDETQEVLQALLDSFETSSENPLTETIDEEPYQPIGNFLDLAAIEEATQAEAPVALRENPLPRQTAPAAPAFDWGNWLSDNAINLLLFLGAFLVVAAVSFFMWSQWGNLDNTVKFGFVLSFTVAWYGAGLLFNRGESFKTVGITFITIGALLTPFVGVGYHQFLLNGDMNSIGIVWLITSAFSTILYMILSIVFSRRYFTYFGTLSILAMLLSLVQLSQVPQTYFILAGAVTGLILLVGRISLRLFPALDNHMGEDYELSSLATLFLSIAFGLGVVIIQGESSFFSLDVFAVGLVAVIYLWVYCSLHSEDIYLLGAQVLTVMVTGHGAYSLSNEPMMAFVAMFTMQFTLQILLHFVFKNSNRLQNAMHHMSLAMAALVYGLSISLPKDAFYQMLSAGMALVFMMQLSFYVRRFNQPVLYFGAVALSYAALAHALLALNISITYWGFAFVALGLLETLAASFVRDVHLRRAQLGLSLFLMAASGFVALGSNLETFIENRFISAYGTAFAALMGFAIISLIEEKRSHKLLPGGIHAFSALMGIAYFALSLPYNNDFATAALGLASSLMFYLAYRHQFHGILMAGAAIMLYPTLATFLRAIQLDEQFWVTAFVALASLEILVAYLPLEKNLRLGAAYIGVIGLGLSAFLGLNYFQHNTIVIATAFAAMGVYVLLSLYELFSENRFFERLVHLAGIATGMGVLLTANWIKLTPLTLLGFALLLNALLALWYRHFPQRWSMMALGASLHLPLWFVLQFFAVRLSLPYFLLLSALQISFAYYSVFSKETRSSLTTVGVWAMVSYLSIAAILGHPAANQSTISLIMVWLGLGYLAIFEESQRRLQENLVDSFSRQLPIIAAAIAYGISFAYLESPFINVSYGFALLYFLITGYRHSTNRLWLYAGMSLFYPILLASLHGANISSDYWGIATAILGAAQVLLLYLPIFDEKTRLGISYIGIAGMGLSSLYMLYPNLLGDIHRIEIDTLENIALLGILTVFALLGLLEIGKKRVDNVVHLLPVGIAVLAYLPIFPNWERVYFQSLFSMAFALAFSVHLAIVYRHNPHKLYLFGMTLAFYPALLHLLDFTRVPFEFYPPSIALLSLGIYTIRKQLVGESGSRLLTAIVLVILAATSISPYFVIFNEQSYQLLSWSAGYFFLLILWHSRLIPDRQIHEFVLGAAVYAQYLMHLDFAIRYTPYAVLFSDIQWFSGGLAAVLLVLSLREAHFNQNKLPLPMIYATAAVALLPSYYQSLATGQSTIYALMGILYGLLISAIGILYRQPSIQSIGVLGVIIAVLIPTGEFILSQPWWVILLLVGLLLIVLSVVLTGMRRNPNR